METHPKISAAPTLMQELIYARNSFLRANGYCIMPQLLSSLDRDEQEYGQLQTKL
jgi:hypothetical protein